MEVALGRAGQDNEVCMGDGDGKARFNGITKEGLLERGIDFSV